MTGTPPDGERFLSRWSRLKRAHAGDAEAVPAPPVQLSVAAPIAGTEATAANAANTANAASTTTRTPAANVTGTVTIANATNAATRAPATDAAASTPAASEAAPPPLPSVESLNIDSDYAQFFQPKVPEALRRAAVKKLFADPHFNVMDGLDTYIDDYSKSDPIPPAMLAQLVQAQDIIDHPSNRKPDGVEQAPVATTMETSEQPVAEQLDGQKAIEQPNDVGAGQSETQVATCDRRVAEPDDVPPPEPSMGSCTHFGNS